MGRTRKESGHAAPGGSRWPPLGGSIWVTLPGSLWATPGGSASPTPVAQYRVAADNADYLRLARGHMAAWSPRSFLENVAASLVAAVILAAALSLWAWIKDAP